MTQLSREDWLQHGLVTLAEDGVDALRIDALCKRLGVTKGSFYHHFKNHRAYLEAILQHWEDEYTSRFITISDEGATPIEKLDRLNEQVLESFGEHEVHIRTWALSDPLAREFQERVDTRRIAYLTDLYLELLRDEHQAQAMAHLAYTTLIGSASVIPPLTKQQFSDMMALVPPLIQILLREDEP